MFQLKMITSILAILLGCQMVCGKKLDTLSFDGPYDNVDANGKRELGSSWSYGNAAEVKQHFVRLTPDRQSKNGYVWNSEKIAGSQFSSIVAFRISGQAKRWFGDGIGIWITKHGNYVRGQHHGFTEKYVGVGIVLDTFKNTDHKGGHKDISIMVNDGTRTLDDMNADTKLGCNAEIRFHEGHAGFNPVYSSSRLKIQVNGKRLQVAVDASGSGDWTNCFDAEVPLPANWMAGSSFGITAATGSLADNHDILRVVSYDESEDPAITESDSDAMLHNMSKEYSKWIDSESCGNECKISIIQKQMNDLKIEFEHKMTDLLEKTENTVQKLKAKETENEHKIEDLEKQVSTMVDQSMSTKMEGIGRTVNKKIETHVKSKVLATSGSWKTPFFLLIILISATGFMMYRKYQQLRKSHLL